MGEAKRRAQAGEQVAPFRLAIREEGPWIHVYFAATVDVLPDLEGAAGTPLLVATLRTTAGHMPGVRDAFLKFCESLTGSMLESVLGEPVTSRIVIEEPPEHERPGHA